LLNISSFAETFLDDADAAAVIATLGALASTTWAPFPVAITRVSDYVWTAPGDWTGLFHIGARIRYDDSGLEYGTVIGSSVDGTPTTTVTMAGNTSYAMSSGVTTTSLAYSYALIPPGYSTWWAWSPTLTGWSADPSNAANRFAITGRKCEIMVAQTTAGTSGSTSKSITLPVTPRLVTNGRWYGTGYALNNNSAVEAGLVINSNDATGVLTNGNTGVAASWTASGNCRITTLTGWFEI